MDDPTLSLKLRRLFNENHEEVGMAIFNVVSFIFIAVFVTQEVVWNFPGEVRLIGGWMWWLLIPWVGGMLLAQWDEI